MKRERDLEIQGLLFDLDGTIVHTQEANLKAYNFALLEYGLGFKSEEFKSINGMDSRKFLAEIFPHLHANKSWFSDSDHKGATFVAFPTDTVLKDAKFLDLIKTADSEYVIDKWTVLIYSENPANLIGQLP